MKNIPATLFLFFLTFLVSSKHASASLTWIETQKTIKITPTDHYGRLEFEATNLTPSTIEITEIKPFCECTTATATKMILKQGEETKLQIEITPPTHGGNQTKSLIVKTDDGKTQTLTVAIQMPDTFEISTSHLQWTDGAEKKMVKITLKPETIFLKADSLSQDFDTTTQKISENEYEISATPLKTGIRGTLRLQFSYKQKPFFHYVSLTHGPDTTNPAPNQTQTKERLEQIYLKFQALEKELHDLIQSQNATKP